MTAPIWRSAASSSSASSLSSKRCLSLLSSTTSRSRISSARISSNSSSNSSFTRSFNYSSTSNSSTTTTTTTSNSSSSPPPLPPPTITSSSSLSSSVSQTQSNLDSLDSQPSSKSVSGTPTSKVVLQILATSWLTNNSKKRLELEQFLKDSIKNPSIQPPGDLSSLSETIRSYRAVRSRLWIPDSNELFKAKTRFEIITKGQNSEKKEEMFEILLSNGTLNFSKLLGINRNRNGEIKEEDGERKKKELEKNKTNQEGESLPSKESQDFLNELYQETLSKMTSGERKHFKNELNDQEKQDLIFKKVWCLLTKEERKRSLIRVNFECIRKLGWRKGYTSGFPLNQKQAEENDSSSSSSSVEEILEKRKNQLKSLLPIMTSISESESKTSKLLKTKQEFYELEEKLAFESWKKMSDLERNEELKSSWSLRDRGRLFISSGNLNSKLEIPNSELTTKVLGKNSPRWYSEPIRTGEMIYLPNTLIRLVKNHTPSNEPYDAYKATFRIPYSMHKHALKNYLLSIYGLRITWIRTMIYRSSRVRLAPGGSKELRDRGFGRRNFKKAEVGLFEPFVFPEIGESFKRQGLLGEEMEVERMSGMIKLRGGKRWRSKRLPDVYQDGNGHDDDVKQMGTKVHQQQQLLENGNEREIVTTQTDKDGNTKVIKVVQKLGNKNRLAKRPKLLVRSQGIPTAKHSRILQMLGWKNEEREEKIQEILQKK